MRGFIRHGWQPMNERVNLPPVGLRERQHSNSNEKHKILWDRSRFPFFFFFSFFFIFIWVGSPRKNEIQFFFSIFLFCFFLIQLKICTCPTCVCLPSRNIWTRSIAFSIFSIPKIHWNWNVFRMFVVSFGCFRSTWLVVSRAHFTLTITSHRWGANVTWTVHRRRPMSRYRLAVYANVPISKSYERWVTQKTTP